MTLLPIVVREMRVAARRGSTYWYRTGAAVLVLVLCLWIMGMTRYQTTAETAMILFGVTTGVCGLFALLSGLRFTSDCLSAEKREGTLGLLFLTDLRGYDIVLGKLVAASLDAFYGVLAVVPIMALPLLLGGVSVYEFMRMMLVILNALFFSLATGILASSFSRSLRTSNAFALLIIAFLTIGFPLIGAWVSRSSLSSSFPVWFMVPSPGFGYVQAYDASYTRYAKHFWISLAVVHGLAWLFLAAACRITPGSWQDRPRSSRSSNKLPLNWQNFISGPVATAKSYRQMLLDINPYFWLAARGRRQRGVLWAVLGLMAIVWLAAWAKWRGDWTEPSTFFITGGVLNLLFRSWFASEACRQMAQDRHTGAFELLLSSPLEPREIVHGQMLALRRMFAGPLAAVLIIEIVFLIATVQDTYMGDRGEAIAVWIGMMGMLIVDVLTLPAPCMWFALTCRQANQAPGRALSWVLVFPWLMLAGFLMLSMGSRITFETVLGIWAVLGLATDFVLGSWARLNLREGFREAAARRFAPKKSLLDRLTGN